MMQMCVSRPPSSTKQLSWPSSAHTHTHTHTQSDDVHGRLHRKRRLQTLWKLIRRGCERLEEVRFQRGFAISVTQLALLVFFGHLSTSVSVFLYTTRCVLQTTQVISCTEAISAAWLLSLLMLDCWYLCCWSAGVFKCSSGFSIIQLFGYWSNLWKEPVCCLHMLLLFFSSSSLKTQRYSAYCSRSVRKPEHFGT